MRVDKYLWCVRLFKTRTAAATHVSKGKVRLNGGAVKTSKEVQVGDVIAVHNNTAVFEYKIKALPKSRLGAKLVGDFLLNCTLAEELAKKKLYQENQSNYRSNGSGKPSSKERRDLKQFLSKGG